MLYKIIKHLSGFVLANPLLRVDVALWGACDEADFVCHVDGILRPFGDISIIHEGGAVRWGWRHVLETEGTYHDGDGFSAGQWLTADEVSVSTDHEPALFQELHIVVVWIGGKYVEKWRFHAWTHTFDHIGGGRCGEYAIYRHYQCFTEVQSGNRR